MGRNEKENSLSVISQCLTLNLLTTTIVAPPSNASKWQMGFNSAFKGLTLGSNRIGFYYNEMVDLGNDVISAKTFI
jgi:hypothetical protein